MTERQAALLRFIAVYQREHDGVSPSFEEMAEGIGGSAKSKAQISAMLRSLEADGHICRAANRARCITILPQSSDLSAIPDEAILLECLRRRLNLAIAA